MRKSFRDPVTNVLKAHGYVTTNDPGDIAQDEQDDFPYAPGKFRYTGAFWEPYVAPPTPTQTRDAEMDAAIQADTTIAQLKTMTAAEFDTWWAANVTNAAQAIAVLKRLTRVIIRKLL